ncbi:hypothetical protein CHH55_00980 [Niallia circulans]|uniref:Uncharacterized protein n=1 Tax=Niallia circulans TaxID=1397 RepID=A0A0J1IQF4_NIACI|nr:hypothetical protein ABW02_00145 [Niallia circulans]PAD26890.1 hypothetical protein CHH62_04170 [Niallia circulans]PAD89924.1 hypothetical protein CHH55_00980 [Niallia circulans]
MQMELLCIDWNGRGETLWDLRDSLRFCRPLGRSGSARAPRKAYPCNGNQFLFKKMYMYKLKQTPNY